MTTRNDALDALTACLAAALAPMPVTRDPEKAVAMSEIGIAVVRDGDPGDPEVAIGAAPGGGPLFDWLHQAEVEFMVIGADRTAVADAALGKVEPALAQDRTLGGTVDHASVMIAPEISEIPVEKAATVRAALLRVQLEYTTASAAG